MERLPSASEKIREVVIAAPLDGQPPVGQLVNTMTDSSVRKALRIKAGYHMLTRPFEVMGFNIEGRLASTQIKTDNLPFTPGETPLIGKGWESYVFRLPAEKPHVLKVDKASVGKTTGEQIERAKELRAQHEQVKEWFGDIEDFVVPSTFIIGQLPYRNKAAVGIVQPCVDDPKGLLEDYSDEKLSDMFAKHPKFRSSFIAVASRIISLADNKDVSLDLAGERNLCVTAKNGEPTLVLMDSCSVSDLAFYREQPGDFMENFERNKARLEEIVSSALDIEIETTDSLQNKGFGENSWL